MLSFCAILGVMEAQPATVEYAAVHQPGTSKAKLLFTSGFCFSHGCCLITGAAPPGGVALIKLLARKTKWNLPTQELLSGEVLSGAAMLGAPSALLEPPPQSARHLALHRSAKAALLSAVGSEIFLLKQCQRLCFGSFARSTPLARLLLSRSKLYSRGQTHFWLTHY